ncbi:WASH complex subunit 2-like [Prorops nasuta]|uniref:WASH complex subunit 2-like n=1 Tax=Prorops nasuta TaxID=863751 RepID=UPI0034CEFB86
MDKSWDHPWSTNEMREKRQDWSLAGDTGLLKHLQQFSENLMTKANKTQEALNTLTSQLNETSVFIDNITNTSLALANTQFIESRVQEDDIEILNKMEDIEEVKNQKDIAPTNFVSSVSESIKQGISLMEEKYKRMEVTASDSEDEGNPEILSVIMANNPYQNRQLPYVIGSDKWEASNKIRLESSSSESEQLEKEDTEELQSDVENEVTNHIIRKSNLSHNKVERWSSSSSESDNHNTHISKQKIANADSDSVLYTQESLKPPSANSIATKFAEDLAKRLGNIGQAQETVSVIEDNEKINDSKDDVFRPIKDTEESRHDQLFNDDKGLFDNQTSKQSWKNNPRNPLKINILPPVSDVPPPISNISTNPKSAIDDLFDADSEDSDNIFTTNVYEKKNSLSNKTNINEKTLNVKNTDLDKQNSAVSVFATNPGIPATSTPTFNTANLFNDNEKDDGGLFKFSKKDICQSEETLPSGLLSTERKKPEGNVSVLHKALLSDMEKLLASRKQQVEADSDNGAVEHEAGVINESIVKSVSQPEDISNNLGSSIAGSELVSDIDSINESTYTSGISNQPPSFNIEESSLEIDFEPQGSSSHLKSQELYRERVASDSLFTSPNSNNRNGNNTMNNNPLCDINLFGQQGDIFDNDEVFGPPPLPKANTKPYKNQVRSLFDDSDSGDELFSTTSSGSRSQKSSDFLAPQIPDKSKSYKGLFDANVDIFSSQDSPDVDIFGINAQPPIAGKTTDTLPKKIINVQPSYLTVNTISKGENLFDKSEALKSSKKGSLFDDDNDNNMDNDDLFGTNSFKKLEKYESRVDKNSLKDDQAYSVSEVKSSIVNEDKLFNQEESKDTGCETDITYSKSTMQDEQVESGLSDRKTFAASNKSYFIFDDMDEDFDDLFNKKKSVKNENSDRNNLKNIIEKTEISKVVEEEKSAETKQDHSDKELNKLNLPNVPSFSDINLNAQNDKTGKSSEPNKSKVVESIVRMSPPKTLNIRNVISSTSEDDTQAPKREVSSKIKDLMGKMGDLKILSPTDVPPILKKGEDNLEDDKEALDRDSDDGGCLSVQSRSSRSFSDETPVRKASPESTVSHEGHEETAINFDQPVHIETLVSTASKNRVRIQAKRRPQSRQARKSALKEDGQDFDAADAISSLSKDVTLYTNSICSDVTTTTENLESSSTAYTGMATVDDTYPTEAVLTLGYEDKSEIGSISKESSMSINKNTLLSPSTDEEDLFDVLPDLPEDSQKDDNLFTRAPILSPIEKVLPVKSHFISCPKNSGISKAENPDNKLSLKEASNDASKYNFNEADGAESATRHKIFNDNNESSIKIEKKEDEADVAKSFDKSPTDPLRDSSHDPLKDPSQLFAFVTKTPSPDKGKTLLFSEDDSLFSSDTKTSIVNDNEFLKKPALDLFTDDTSGDLFSAPSINAVVKPLKETKIGLFDNDVESEDDDSLFGSNAKQKSVTSEALKSSHKQNLPRSNKLFDEDDDDDANLFGESSDRTSKTDSLNFDTKDNSSSISSKQVKNSNLDNLFGESIEDDLFTTKTTISKKVKPLKSVFADDSESLDDPIFSKSELNTPNLPTRPVVKKAVTRDLKKTAEKIVKDPLSILRDD